jgi:hypothetical protein
MNEKDDIILEHLRDIHPSAEPPAVAHWNIHENPEIYDLESRAGGGFVLQTYRNRVNRLQNLGLVSVVNDAGRYRRITEEGLRYLAGELDASALEG